MPLKYRTIPRKHRTMPLKHRPYVGIKHRHQSPIRHSGHKQFGEMPFDNGYFEDDRSNLGYNHGHFRHKHRDLEEHSGHLEDNHVHFRHNRDLEEHSGQLEHNLGHKRRDLEQHNGHLEHNRGHLGHRHRDLEEPDDHLEVNHGDLGHKHRDLEEHDSYLGHNKHGYLGHKHRDLEEHNGHLGHNHSHLGHKHGDLEEHNGHLGHNHGHLGHKHRDLEEHNDRLEHNHGRFRHKHTNLEHHGNFRRNNVTEQFGNKNVVVGHQTRLRGSPTEMMAPNGILYSPSPPEMVTHVPVDSNHYGRAGTPGGSRVIISSPTGREFPTLPSPGSSVNYTYSTPLTPVHVPGFEGNNARTALPENPSPSESNVTMDYDQWLQNDGYERGHGRIDHFPRAGRGSPDSMAYMHRAPNKKARARNTDNQEPPSNSCCIIS